MPLEGVLEIRYDYSSYDQYTADEFIELTPGRVWLYNELLPLKIQFDLEILSLLELPNIPLIKAVFGSHRLLLMDESRNPSLSYKDRASLLIALKAIELGRRDIAAASTGNAASSLACICAKLNLNAHIFVPASIPEAKLLQIKAYGAEIYEIEGDYDTAFDRCITVSKKKGWYNRNTAYNPLTIEGKKSALYDMFIKLKGRLPEAIVVPVGDGVIIGGIYKGVCELAELGWIERMPRLIAVQAEGSDALVRYLETGKFEFIPARTIADSISAGAPRNLYMAAEAVEKTGGFAITVTDEQMLKAQRYISENWGIMVEPSCAAALAAVDKMIAENDFDPEELLLLLTGNGLKDLDSLRKSVELK
jgi:threonine synthase